MRAQPSNSFTRTMKTLNMNMHADDPADACRPAKIWARNICFELSLPYGLDVNDQIDVDKSSLRVNVTYGDVDVKVVEREVAQSEAWLARMCGFRAPASEEEVLSPTCGPPLGHERRRRWITFADRHGCPTESSRK